MRIPIVPSSQPESLPPDPKKPYALTYNDRKLLKSLRIRTDAADSIELNGENTGDSNGE